MDINPFKAIEHVSVRGSPPDRLSPPLTATETEQKIGKAGSRSSGGQTALANFFAHSGHANPVAWR